MRGMPSITRPRSCSNPIRWHEFELLLQLNSYHLLVIEKIDIDNELPTSTTKKMCLVDEVSGLVWFVISII